MRHAAASVLGIGCLLWGGYLAWVLLRLPPPPIVLPELVVAQLDGSGVSNPVTAVLLNYRAYDTLLEVAVLVVTVASVWGLGHAVTATTIGREAAAEPVLSALVRIVIPLAVLMAVYLTWIGSHSPGGAFQAGALLAGAAVLLLLRGFGRPPRPHLLRVRSAVSAGLAVFLAVAAATLVGAGRMLEYRGGAAYAAILMIEAVLAVSIAAILAELFIDVPAAGEAES